MKTRHACMCIVMTMWAFSACAIEGGSSDVDGSGVDRASPASVAESAGDLESRVRARLDALDATTSLYARHVPSGREISIRADQPMNTLSVIKIPIMIRAFRDVETGSLDLEERYAVRPEDLRGGSGILQQFAVGLSPTYRDLVTQMIATSDNTATDIMIARLGLDRVNEMLSDLGYSETRLRLTTGQIFKGAWVRDDPANVEMTDREVYEQGFPPVDPDFSFRMEGDSTMWLGRTTAREMGRLLEQMLSGEVTTETHAAEMFDIMDGQLYTSRIPRLLRFDARVANKTGDWGKHAGNDVAVLFYEGGPTILSTFTNQNRGDFYALEEAVGQIAKDVIETWR